jgi:hypothetical protein
MSPLPQAITRTHDDVAWFGTCLPSTLFGTNFPNTSFGTFIPNTHDVAHDTHDMHDADVHAYNNMNQTQKLWKALNEEHKNRKICTDSNLFCKYFSLEDAAWFADIAKYVDGRNSKAHNLHVATTLLMYEALQ